MTPQGLAKLKKLEREMRKLRNETEDIHGQIRGLLWSEEEALAVNDRTMTEQLANNYQPISE